MSPRRRTHRLVLDRHHGHRGSLIVPHRSIRTLDLEFSRVALTLLVGFGLSITWIAIWNSVADGWAGLQQWMLGFAQSDASVIVVRRSLGSWLWLEAPSIVAPSTMPTNAQWWWGLVAWALVLIASFPIAKRWLPLAYALRLLCLVQASALFFFRSGRGFPYDVASYTEVMHYAGMLVVALTPLLFGLTFYPLDFSRSRKLAITLVAMAHLAVFVPMQVLLHGVLLAKFSLLYMPLLFWAFGLTVDVFVLISFYGWAASWKPLPYRHRSWWIPLRPMAPAMAVVLMVMLLLSCAARASGEEVPWEYELRGTASYGEYDRGLGSLDSQGVRFNASRYFQDSWSLSLGRAARLGEEGIGFGAGWRKHLRRDRSISLGLSSGTGDVLFPRWRLDAGVEQGFLGGDPLLLSLGYTHLQSKAENRSDGLALGARWYGNAPWILSSFGRIEFGHPGDTVSRGAGVGVLWHRPELMTLSLGVEVGEVSYVLLMPDEAAVDFDSFVWRLGASRPLDAHWSVGARYENFQSDVYDLWSIGIEVARRW